MPPLSRHACHYGRSFVLSVVHVYSWALLDFIDQYAARYFNTVALAAKSLSPRIGKVAEIAQGDRSGGSATYV